MFRNIMVLAGVVGMMSAAGAETIIPGGNVSGTWAATGSPFLIMGEITVPSGQTLNIEPGVQVIFQGHYKLIVNGWLLALGTEQDSILFTAADTSVGWHGIRFVDAPDSSRLFYCKIKYGKANGLFGSPYDDTGGGILCASSNPTIEHCLIENCSANYGGGGIFTIMARPVIAYCKIAANSVLVTIAYGGGICCEDSSGPLIRENIIIENSCQRGGGISILGQSYATIIGNLIRNNSAVHWGGGINIQDSPNTLLINNTIISNSAGEEGGGIHTHAGTPEIVNCIIWGNGGQQIVGDLVATYSDIQGGWPGMGNIDADPLFVTGPDGEYYLSQIAAGQAQQSPCVDAGDPASPMIDGTTRTDGVPDQGVVDMGFHYAAFAPPPPPPPLWIDLTLLSSPTLPPTGGVVQYRITVGNDSTAADRVDVWIMVKLPGGAMFGPVVGPVAVIFLPNWSTYRDRNLIVGAAAPTGVYWVVGYVGDHDWINPIVFDADSVSFTKSGMDAMAGDPWLADSGEPFDVGARRASPLQHMSGSGATPTMEVMINPFNPTTAIRFDLPQAGWVKLEVFDISGRHVELSGSGTTPTTGWYPAGAHEVTFDGTGLTAGVYIARLTAVSGSGATPTIGVEKMVLLK